MGECTYIMYVRICYCAIMVCVRVCMRVCVRTLILSHALICVQHSCRRLEDVLDDEKAVIVTRFLASFRSLSKSFDYLLRQVRTYVCTVCTQLTALHCMRMACGVHMRKGCTVDLSFVCFHV